MPTPNLPPDPRSDAELFGILWDAYKETKRLTVAECGPTDLPAMSYFVRGDTLVEVSGGFRDPGERERVFAAGGAFLAPAAVALVCEAYLRKLAAPDQPLGLALEEVAAQYPPGTLSEQFNQGRFDEVQEVVIGAFRRRGGKTLMACESFVIDDDGSARFTQRRDTGEMLGAVPELLADVVEIAGGMPRLSDEEAEVGLNLLSRALGPDYAVRVLRRA